MELILNFIQILLAISVVALIFLQAPGNAESNSNILSTTSFEKRGWEKFTFNLTIAAIILFVIISLVQTLV